MAQRKRIAKCEFEGALAQRVFITIFVISGLAGKYETQAQVLRLLEAYDESIYPPALQTLKLADLVF